MIRSPTPLPASAAGAARGGGMSPGINFYNDIDYEVMQSIQRSKAKPERQVPAALKHLCM